MRPITNDCPPHRLHRWSRGGANRRLVRSRFLTWAASTTRPAISSPHCGPSVVFAIVSPASWHPCCVGFDSGCTGACVGSRACGRDQSLYQTVITLTLSFLRVTFGSLLVAIQVAGGSSRRSSSRRHCCATTSSGTALACLFSRWSSPSPRAQPAASVDRLACFVTGISRHRVHRRFPVLINYTTRLLRPVSVLRGRRPGRGDRSSPSIRSLRQR